MPVSYTKTSGQGHVYQVPDYPEAADAPKAFKDYSDFLDLILPPVGTIMPFVGTSAPGGWLLCDGAQYPSTIYPKLSALCGTKFGTATAGNFRVPDLRGRVIAGVDSSQSEFDTIGETGGAKSVTLTVSNMPAHNHTASVSGQTISGLTLSGMTVSGLAASTAGDHSHTASTDTTGAHTHTTSPAMGVHDNTTTGGSQNRLATAGTWTANYSTTSSGSHSHTVSVGSGGGHSHTISGSISGGTISGGTISGGTVTVNNSGSGTAVNILNPYITMNHIIRAA